MNYNINKGGTGKILKKGNENLYNIYVNEISKYPPLTREEEQKLFIEYSNTGNEKIIEKICRHNLLFVLSVARHYSLSISSSRTLVLEDLINDGNLGLCIAARKFDYTKDIKFISYAVWWIRQCIIKSIQDNVKTIRLPSSTRKDIVSVTNKKLQMEQEFCDDISMDKVLYTMFEEGEVNSDEKVSELRHLMNVNQYEDSLNRVMVDGEKAEIIDFISDDKQILPDAMVVESERTNFLYKLIADMDEKSVKYITDFYGIGTEKPLSYREIAEKYNTTPSTVRSRMSSAMKKVALKNKNFELIY